MKIAPYIQSRQEEMANALIHLAGFILSFVAVAVLIVMASRHGAARLIVSCSVYGGTLIFLYLSSTLYHVLPPGKAKDLFHYLDHNSIFLLIAGTYTPFTLVTLGGAWGWSIFGTIWGLALMGSVMKIALKKPYPVISTALYLLMGWLIVIAIKPLFGAMPLSGFLWLVTGGICYSAGVVFFALAHRRYFHAIWHVFVLMGSVCHFFAIFFTVFPGQ